MNANKSGWDFSVGSLLVAAWTENEERTKNMGRVSSH